MCSLLHPGHFATRSSTSLVPDRLIERARCVTFAKTVFTFFRKSQRQRTYFLKDEDHVKTREHQSGACLRAWTTCGLPTTRIRRGSQDTVFSDTPLSSPGPRRASTCFQFQTQLSSESLALVSGTWLFQATITKNDVTRKSWPFQAELFGCQT